jgi:hypothetical protein
MKSTLCQSSNNPYTAWAIAITQIYYYITFFLGLDGPSGSEPIHYWGFEVTLSHTTLCRTPMDEWSARRRDMSHDNTQHSQQTHIHVAAGFEPAIPSSERPQTHALGRAATAIGLQVIYTHVFPIVKTAHCLCATKSIGLSWENKIAVYSENSKDQINRVCELKSRVISVKESVHIINIAH